MFFWRQITTLLCLVEPCTCWLGSRLRRCNNKNKPCENNTQVSAALTPLDFFSILLGFYFLSPASFISVIFFFSRLLVILMEGFREDLSSFKTPLALGSSPQASLSYSLTGTDRKSSIMLYHHRGTGISWSPWWLWWYTTSTEAKGIMGYLPEQRYTWASCREV